MLLHLFVGVVESINMNTPATPFQHISTQTKASHRHGALAKLTGAKGGKGHTKVGAYEEGVEDIEKGEEVFQEAFKNPLFLPRILYSFKGP